MSGVNGIFLSWYTGLFLSPKNHSSISVSWKILFPQIVVKCWYLSDLLFPKAVSGLPSTVLSIGVKSDFKRDVNCWLLGDLLFNKQIPPPNHPTADCWDSSYSFRWNSLRQLIGVNFLVVDKPIHAQSSTYSRVRWSEIILQERCKFLTDGRTIINQLNPPPIYYLFVFETVLILSVGIYLDN